MGAGGRRRNLKRKRTRQEPTASASSDFVDHEDDDLMKRNSNKKPELPATKPTAQEEEAAQPTGKEKKEKRKRVVRERWPEDLIHVMMVQSHYVLEIPDERLAWSSVEFQASYAERKASSEKWQAEQQALIDQYLINGYAESVREVTDNEDDGDGEKLR